MVATSATQTQARSGLRPVQPRRDLAAVADLIETCFADSLDAGGRAMLRDMRLMANSHPLVWALARLGQALPPLEGYVWIEDDRLVGNVSITPARYDRGWVVANVAVYPEYRRRGIARRLMEAALDRIAQRGQFAVLQVDADNGAACRLYDDLGFETQRVFTRWRRASYHRPPDLAPGDAERVRRLWRWDSAALLALAEDLRPNRRGGIGWLRPARARNLRPSGLGVLHYLFSGQHVDYWGVADSSGELDAALRVEQRMGSVTVLFDLLVRQAQRGALEPVLLRHLLNQYPRRPFVTDHPADHPAIRDLMPLFRFRPERTLAHMIWHVPSDS